MKILPDITQPWRRKIARRHRPSQAHGDTGYREYRSCLRWEFGFTCAFCLSHETDLMLSTEGWAVMQVEHFEPKTRNPSRINDYENCFYICRLCNTARSNTPNRDSQGREMINPCDAVWRDHFQVEGDEIRPRNEADINAALTSERYDFGDPRKVRLRRVRRKLITERIGFLEETRDLEESLLDAAVAGGGGPGMLKHVDTARAIGKARRNAYEELLRYAVIPPDPSLACTCDHHEAQVLPLVLDEQTIDLSEFRESPSLKRSGRGVH
jgi:hypothetical protein